MLDSKERNTKCSSDHLMAKGGEACALHLFAEHDFTFYSIDKHPLRAMYYVIYIMDRRSLTVELMTHFQSCSHEGSSNLWILILSGF